MKWTMTDNKKAVADISGTEPVARGEAFSRKSQKKKEKKRSLATTERWQQLSKLVRNTHLPWLILIKKLKKT